MLHIFLYGPPGSGKSTLGKNLAAALEMPFIDLDVAIENEAEQTIPAIFAAEGESGFRARELTALAIVCQDRPAVISLGGGALLNPQARAMAEDVGQVLLLHADFGVLVERLGLESTTRPLLAGDTEERLKRLLDERKDHYASFPARLDTSEPGETDIIWQAQLQLGAFCVRGMGSAYNVRIERNGLARLGAYLRDCGLGGPVAVVSDTTVGAIYGKGVLESLEAAGYTAQLHCIPEGEINKNIETVTGVWDFFVRAGVDRGSTVLALGGGVVGDLSGFAAATFLRGIPWVNFPTTLLAMVDSSLGGKTGIDLPQAKNLVGAFYPPRLVLTDPGVLASLPLREMRGGMAEVVKHGLIGDTELFNLCAGGWDAIYADVDKVIRQGMAVKLKVIEVDPYEKGLRQALNLGHTIGHGVELASDFQLSHGEAVSIGTAAEARLAEDLGIATMGLYEQVIGVLDRLGLPVEIPEEIALEQVIEAMQHDKKRAAGTVRFALPVRVGEVRVGVTVNDWQARVLSQLAGERGAQ